MQRNASPKDSDQIERPLRVLLSTIVAANLGIPKCNGKTADLGHHVKRHEKVEEDGKHVRFSREPG
jgi:hypothetical protein